ncbi:MAG: D-aminoacyl-tRNA deacylase [Gammaproteobacteria bacterium]
MIGLIQRVRYAQVDVHERRIARIGPGLLVLAGVERGDGSAQAQRLAERILGYRVFPDQAGRMNLSVSDTGGSLLLVSQFTLAADTGKGMRPSFTSAAPPDDGQRYFNELVAHVAASGLTTEEGQFGADMQVELCNDGPVTFWLRVNPPNPENP